MQESTPNNQALSGGVFSNFLRLAIPSLIGFVSISSASVVDGIFVGNYLGSDSLAAINLIIPLLTFIFGIAFMFSVGGSVRGGKYLGEHNYQAASSIFSKTVLTCFGVSVIIVFPSLIFDEYIYRALGGTDALFPLMSQYFLTYLPFLLLELAVIGLYYFVRLDGFANLAASALTIGALLNILLDYIFIVKLDYGLTGAALATGLSHVMAFLILLIYFFRKKRNLHFTVVNGNWREIFQSAFNGLSEFINEVSGGIVAFILNWLIITSMGVNGVAAITIINYLILMGMMMIFAVSEAAQVFVSQNFGAQNSDRIVKFMLVCFAACCLVSLTCISLLLGYTDPIIQAFLDEDSQEAVVLAKEFIWILWPIFLFNGLTITISAYLTAVHHAKPSALVALSRSLVLPCSLLIAIHFLLPGTPFLWALPLSECITFVLAVYLLYRYQPKHIITAR